MRSLTDKVAVVTGAGSGIGRALALALAARGCHLSLADIDIAGLGETGVLIGAKVRVTTHALDVADRQAVFAFADEVVAQHGGCNLVFNNAGVAYLSSAAAADPQAFARVMNINFWGVVHGTQAFLPHLVRSGDGHVINTASLFALIAVPGQAAYCSSKFAVRGFTETLRLEMQASGAPVAVTCVYPAGVATAIARSARVDASVSEVGLATETAHERIGKLLRITPDKAAAAILRGVRRKDARVLIGHRAVALDVLQRFLPEGYGKAVMAEFKRVR